MPIKERTIIGGIAGDFTDERNYVKIHIELYDVLDAKRSQIETETRDFIYKVKQILENDQ